MLFNRSIRHSSLPCLHPKRPLLALSLYISLVEIVRGLEFRCWQQVHGLHCEFGRRHCEYLELKRRLGQRAHCDQMRVTMHAMGVDVIVRRQHPGKLRIRPREIKDHLRKRWKRRVNRFRPPGLLRWDTQHFTVRTEQMSPFRITFQSRRQVGALFFQEVRRLFLFPEEQCGTPLRRYNVDDAVRQGERIGQTLIREELRRFPQPQCRRVWHGQVVVTQAQVHRDGQPE